jgi:acyl-CoA reductase-like NAD-dependent aldehyde dehydrogenase
MLKETYPYYLANEAVYDNADLDVTDKFTGAVATRVAMADANAIDQAIAAAVAAEAPMAAMPPYERQAILYHCVKRFTERAEELADALCIEAGKPIKDARGEVSRLIDTFRVAAEEAVRIGGEVLNLEIAPRAKGYRGFTKRVPVGACSFISPFNFPLNLAAHKVAPAIAAGCPFVLKPASRTPIGALIIGEILAETDLPKGAFSILPCHRDGADLFTEDNRLKLLSFTGSPAVGWDLKARAGKKKVVLELGGNAACVVDENTNLDDAVTRGSSLEPSTRVARAASAYSASMAIVSQYAELKSTAGGKSPFAENGRPERRRHLHRPDHLGRRSANASTTGFRKPSPPAPPCCAAATATAPCSKPPCWRTRRVTAPLFTEEAFGPVAVLEPFEDFHRGAGAGQRQCLRPAGRCLHPRSVSRTAGVGRTLDVGGVVIGDVPSWRVDNMPYGGVKDSGLGREGIRWAIADMTEERLLVIRTP